MRRHLIIGVALVMLAVVMAILIAPDVDLPETVLREHHLTLHNSGTHTLAKLDAIAAATFTFSVDDWSITHSVTQLARTPHTQSQVTLALRC